jgi:hypothetical protein
MRLSFIYIAALVAIVSFIGSSDSKAGDITSECRAVDQLATIKRPTQLILGIAEDRIAKKCHFVISMPPSNGMITDASKWFDAKLPEDLVKNETISAVLKALALASSERRAKEIGEIIDKNPDFLSGCVATFLKKTPFGQKSKDGRIQCFVPKELNYLEFKISANNAFTLNVYLPRTL